ncbi:MAG: DUF3341 domain-containing protein [Phycisphaeraceae bacterium]
MAQLEAGQQIAAERAAEEPGAVRAIVAEFVDVDTVVAAAKAVHGAGFKYFDVHSPFPIHGLDLQMGIRRTILPWIVLVAGLTGAAGGLTLTVWTMSVDYPFLISGKPLNSLPAWMPVVFECTILLAAFGATFGMFLLNKLPLLYNPLLKVERFRRATDDRFFVVIDARDGHFDQPKVTRMLEELGASAVEAVRD